MYVGVANAIHSVSGKNDDSSVPTMMIVGVVAAVGTITSTVRITVEATIIMVVVSMPIKFSSDSSNCNNSINIGDDNKVSGRGDSCGFNEEEEEVVLTVAMGLKRRKR